MLRLATIGTSWIADYFLEGAAAGAPDICYTAAYSRDAEKGAAFAAKHGAQQVFTSLEALASSPDIDAVYIASPNILHYEQARQMLLGGKHVICEKTCVPYSAQLAELFSIAGERGLIFMEAIKLPHLPEMRKLLDAMPLCGKPHLARFDFSRYSSKYPLYLAGETPNIFNPKLAAGALMDMGIYSVYPAVQLFGEPETVEARAVFMRTGADGALAAVLGYPDMVASVTVSKMSRSYVDSTIQGDEGVISIDTMEHLDNVRFIDVKGVSRTLFTRDASLNPMSGEARDFARYISDPVGTAAEYAELCALTAKVIRTMERIRKAAGFSY